MYGTDFTLTQNGPNELNLTLKQVFLKKNEQGNADINPSITLSSSDGRKFGTHSFKLRVNTPPPVPVYKATGKIQSGGKWFYVLCFKVEGMPGADNLHKDIQKLYVNGLPGSPFTVTSTGGDFGIGSTNGNLVNIGSVHQLAPGDCLMPPEILPSGPWLLCVKTEVGVKTGAAKRYTLKLEDSKGLASLAVTQATPENPYTINSSAPNAWQTLRDAVQDTSGPAVIAIDGTITAPGGAEKINVKRQVTIQGTNKVSDILNANNKCFIFDVWHNGDLTLKNLTLQKGKNTYHTYEGGGAIHCVDGKLTTDNIIIKNCNAKNGGGIYAKASSNSPPPITLNNTEIISCTADGGNGGGVFLYNQDSGTLTVTMKGAASKINSCNTENSDKGGGGVYIKNGTFNMQGGEIKNNKAKTTNGKVSKGGGVLVTDGGKFTMAAGEISGNEAEKPSEATSYGGEVCVVGDNSSLDNSSSFVMTGGKISGNTAGYGGGISTDKAGKFEMQGGIIEHNTVSSSGKGAGVFLFYDSFSIKGNAKIDTDNDIYLKTGKTITIAGNLTVHGKTGRITPEAYSAGTVVLNGESSLVSSNYDKFTVTSYGGQSWSIDSNGKLKKQ